MGVEGGGGGGVEGGKRKGVLSPEAFEAELLRTKQKPLFSMSSRPAATPLHISEEFIDDDPADISFYAGSAEAFGSGDKADESDYDVEELTAAVPDKHQLFSVGIEDLRGGIAGVSSISVGRSETSSLVNNRSECSSLDNLGPSSACESSSLRLPGSDVQSDASSMVNFPACSVRSDGSSALQFGELLEQLEQLSCPPTATEGSADDSDTGSDSDWGSDADHGLFYGNPLAGGAAGLESFLLQCQNLQALTRAEPPTANHAAPNAASHFKM